MVYDMLVFKDVSIVNSGGDFILRSGTVCVILVGTLRGILM